MEFRDKSLTCTECGAEFTFTAGEQQFYQQKGFSNEPRRCRDCRSKKKSAGSAPSESARTSSAPRARRDDAGGADRTFYSATCSQCGGAARLTFQPSPDRPVFCRTCYQARQAERSYR